MFLPDHTLLSEAWAKAERFEAEAQRALLLAQVPRSPPWRSRLAALLLRGAVRLEPRLNVQQSGC